MKQLKMKDIVILIHNLKASGMTLEEINELPIYLGNDDELNGIHNGWFVSYINTNDNDEDTKYIVETIIEDCGTTNIKDKVILIS